MGIPADRIGPYPIERELGRGGMGIVYLGRDPALGRPVAVKVLPEAVAADRERLARFDREARLLAAVHHPNVASIFTVGADEGRRYLALEYVPGETLAERLTRGPLALAEALDVCRQIAAGLEAAHEAGVVHRDLKPANVRLTPEGVAKVLDFGLAKGGATSSETAPSDSFANSPTQTFQSTEPGALLGTVTYMSPEQARGKPVDRRTDVWALGCILYECLTGRAPFAGETTSDVLARILEREPSWEPLPAATPPRVRELLRRSLEKDKNRRLRDVGDARLELEAAEAERSSATAVTVAGLPAPRRRWPKPAVAALVLALLAGAAGWWLGRRSGPPIPPRRVSIALPDDLQVDYLAASPRGEGVLVLGRPRGTSSKLRQLFRRSFDSFDLAPIAGTQRVTNMAFAPNGDVRFIASKEGVENEYWLYSVPFDGSAPPRPLCPWDVRWGSFLTLRDGTDLVTVDTGRAFVRIPPGSQRAEPAIRIDAGFDAFFSFSRVHYDDDRWVLMATSSTTDEGWTQRTVAVDPTTGKGHVVLPQGVAFGLTADGYLLFSRGPTLFAAAFGDDPPRLRGPEVSLFGGMRAFGAGAAAEFALSDDGTLFFVPGGDVSADRQLVACQPGGTCAPWSPQRRRFFDQPDPTVHGSAVTVVTVGARDILEIWNVEADGDARPVVAIPGRDVWKPVWAPDGHRIVHAVGALGEKDDGAYVSTIDGTDRQRIPPGDDVHRDWPVGWLPGSNELVLGRSFHRGGPPDIGIFDLARDKSVRNLLATPRPEWAIAVSPRWRHIAYRTDVTGQAELFLAEVRPGGTMGPPVPLSRGRAWGGAFSPDGRAFYFDDDTAKVRRVALGPDGLPTAEPPTDAVDVEAEHLFPYFTALPDGRLLFVRKGRGEETVSRIDVIPGFAAEVSRRMREAQRRP